MFMKINIAYACNEAYIVQTGISMLSLFENNKKIEEIVIYFIDMGTTEESKNDLKEIAREYNRKLIIIPFSDWENELPVDSTGRHIKSVYAKIFFGRIKEIDRILYIDSDTVIVDDLQELWDTKMGICAIAGVQTVNTLAMRQKIELTKDDLVINDGIVLIDLALWRQYKYEKRCIEFIKKWNGNPPVLSEGTINAVCKDYIYKLDLKYNLTSMSKDYSAKEIKLISNADYYTQDEIEKAAAEPCIIHYVSGFHERPWCKNSTHPFKDEYLKYKKMSKWKDKPLEDGKLSKRTKFTARLHRILPTFLFCRLYHWFGRSNR